jgi:hypothetical protein
MQGQNGRLLPFLQAHETNKELVWEVELGQADRLMLNLDGRRLTVRVGHADRKRPRRVVNPDAVAS